MGQSTFSGPVGSQNGFIPGVFTTAQRNALTNVATGTLIFNTTTGTAQVYNGSAWVDAFVVPPSDPIFAYVRNNTMNELPIAANPAGTKVVTVFGGASTFNLTSYTLGTGWDATSVTSGATFSAPFSVFNSYYPSLAFNADGTKIITIIGNGGDFVNTMTMATPYDISTLSNTWVANGTAITGGSSSLCFAGTRAYTVGAGNVLNQWDLGTAYNVAAFTGAPTKVSTNLFTLFGISFGTLHDITVSADGNYGYMTVTDITNTTLIYQFKFNTAYDVTTIVSTPVHIYDMVALGAFAAGPTNGGGIALDPTGKKMLVTGPSSKVAQLTAP